MTEGQATQWPKEKDRRTSNTMDKRKGQTLCCLSFCPFRLAIVLFVLLSFSFDHCVACPSVIFFGYSVACPSVLFFWALCCLFFCPFLLVIV
jgi:hypothetical protein